MKLYATVTSERASKGQGGNKFIKVALQVEHPNGEREMLPSLWLNEEQDFFSLSISNGSGLKTVYELPKKGEQCTMCDKRKGEKQKGECVYHGVVNCSRCDDFKR